MNSLPLWGRKLPLHVFIIFMKISKFSCSHKLSMKSLRKKYCPFIIFLSSLWRFQNFHAHISWVWKVCRSEEENCFSMFLSYLWRFQNFHAHISWVWKVCSSEEENCLFMFLSYLWRSQFSCYHQLRMKSLPIWGRKLPLYVFIIFMRITIFMLPSVAYDKSAALRKKIASFVCIIYKFHACQWLLFWERKLPP